MASGACTQPREPWCWPVTETAFSRDPDPTTVPFWEAAGRGELLLQRCKACARFQFYPRPFGISCDGEVGWVAASGTGTVYSMTTVRIRVIPELEPPYAVVLVELDEGPRMLGMLAGDEARIGNRVHALWRERTGDLPVLTFEPADVNAVA